MDELIAAAVPDPVDRIDFTALDRPLDGVRAPDLAALQPLVRERIAEDLRQHVDPAHTPHLGAFVAMLSVFGEVTRLAGSGVLSPRSRAFDLGWWQSFFNAVASGPPGFRVRELLALSRAGYVDFLGAGMWVDVVDGGVSRRRRRPGDRSPGDRTGAGRRTAAEPERGPHHRSAARRPARRRRRERGGAAATATAGCCATPA